MAYVLVGMGWNYICILVDLFIIVKSSVTVLDHITAKLVKQEFVTVRGSLENIHIFHTDRGNEFKNQLIEETLEAFDITRSLSHKGCPYDNAVAEATFKTIKTEFIRNQTFANLDALKLQIADYVNWVNNHRIHSSLGYLTPFECRENNLKKLFSLLLTIHT